jgi:cobaltochelatase CobT
MPGEGNPAGAAFAATWRRQDTERLCSAALRALTGERELRLRAGRAYRGHELLAAGAPHLGPEEDKADLPAQRGSSDAIAMRWLASDARLHRALAPEPPIERLVFELLEQQRSEALAALPGVRRNLRRRHEAWSAASVRERLTERVGGLWLYTIVQAVRSLLTGEPPPDADLIEATRAELAGTIGDSLAGLRRHRRDQRGFALHALTIAREVGVRIDAAIAGEAARAHGRGRTAEPPRLALWVEAKAAAGEGSAAADTAGGDSGSQGDARRGYRAHTTAYDREVHAAALVRAAELAEHRERLDRLIAERRVNLPRLVRELRSLLATPGTEGWDSVVEEGRVDGRLLARLIASPTERRLFRRERTHPVTEAAVALLVDCSGSMKVHAPAVAVLVDTIARALDQAGAACELLGFTTAAWHGGRAARDWRRAGSPARPGRLNEVQHLVFKDAATPWRRARRGIAALLKPELFREGVDGEAVDWACERLLALPAAGRVLIVISDGCPHDSATELANEPGLLDEHLRQVVSRREVEGAVAIVGLSLGADPGSTYRMSRVVDLDAGAGHRPYRDLAELLAAALKR